MTRKIIIADIIPLKPAPGSNVIFEIGYNEKTETLRVKYYHNKIFDYVGVSRSSWEIISKNPQDIDELVLIASTNYQGQEVFEK